MSKKLNESALRNELSGSAFFDSPPAPQPEKTPTVRDDRPALPAPAPKPPVATKVEGTPDASLSRQLEDLSLVGYNAHSYRFSGREIRWLRRFCLKASESIDRNVSHNTMVRLLFRLADEEWKQDAATNRLLKLLNELPE